MLLIFFFLISSTSAPKNKNKRRALFSECGGAYDYGMGEYKAGKEKKSQYTHYKKLDYTTGLTAVHRHRHTHTQYLCYLSPFPTFTDPPH